MAMALANVPMAATTRRMKSRTESTLLTLTFGIVLWASLPSSSSTGPAAAAFIFLFFLVVMISLKFEEHLYLIW